MTITTIDPVLGTAVAAAIGTVVPDGINRKITQALAYNTTTVTVSIKIFIVPASQAADSLHTYIDYDLAPRESYTCPELIGAVINPGGQMYVQGLGVAFSAVASDISI